MKTCRLEYDKTNSQKAKGQREKTYDIHVDTETRVFAARGIP